MHSRILILLIIAMGCITGESSDETPTPISDIAESAISITVLESPEEVEAGELISIWWDISSENQLNIPYTALYYDTKSHPEVSADTDPASSGYPLKKVMLGKGPYPVPDEYEALFRLDEPGTIYARAVAEYEGISYWTDEIVLDVIEKGPTPPKTEIIDLPDIFSPGEAIKVKWDLVSEMQLNIETSRVYFGNQPLRGDSSEWDFMEGTRTGDVFEAELPSQEKGFLYLKSQIIADGEEYLCEEKIVTIQEGNDSVQIFIENGIFTANSFHIRKGTTVQWINLDDYVHHLSFIEGIEKSVYINGSVNRTFNQEKDHLYFDYMQPEFRGHVIVQ